MIAPTEASIIAGKYRLLRKLGQGAMGTVWQAEHLTLKSQVAIKFIQVDTELHAEALRRFLREAQAAASLRSPHVVQILDHGVDEGVPYIAMELLEGETLAARLERVGRLVPRETSRVLTQVGRAIARAHEAGIVHRDLKPDNIFLVRNDDEELVKVLDFGIAKSGDAGGVGSPLATDTRSGAVMGTPYYMSPEQTEGAKRVDARSDIWSLGVVAFECMLGCRPFEAEALGALLLAICTKPMPIPSEIASVPAGFDAWFARACARDVNQRFTSAKDAVQELRSICEDVAPATSVPSVWPVVGASTPPPSRSESALSASGGPAGHVAEGFASTQMGRAIAPQQQAKRGLVLGVLVVCAIAIAVAGLLLKSKAVPVSSATASPSIAVTRQSAPTVATATSLPVVPTVGASAAPSASAAPRGASRAAHDRNEPPVRPEPTARATSSPAPWPSNASSVNLGL